MGYLVTSESSHWYTKFGEACHEVDKADGSGKTPTTLRHARKLGLLPSVTNITNIRNKRELNQWLKEQAILAALTATRKEHEADLDFVRRINEDSEKQGKDAAAEGARLHGVIADYLTKGDDLDEGDKVGCAAVKGVCRVLDELNLAVDGCEVTFADKRNGFAGCVDLHAHHKGTGVPAVLDFKTKDGLDRFRDKFGKPKMPAYLFDYGLQLGAYILGSQKDGAMAITVPICRKTGEVLGIAWPKEEIERCTKMFMLEAELWFAINQYDPRKGA